MARLCKFELGSGDVDLQMVSGDYSAEFEEQHAVHVRDHFPAKNARRRITQALLRSQSESLGTASSSSSP